MTSNEKSTTKSRRPVGFIAAGVLIGLAVIAQWTSPHTSHQLANIATAACIVLSILCFVVSWSRGVREPALVRWLPLGLLLFAVVGWGSLFQLVGFTGELVPIFKYRFAPPSDALPDVAEAPTEVASTSLHVTLSDEAYPSFLGPHRDGKLAHRGFALQWKTPPQLVWKQPIGAGLSGVAVVQLSSAEELADDSQGADENALTGESSHAPLSSWVGYTIEQRDTQEWVTCYNLVDGSLRWAHRHDGRHFHILGDLGPRSTPTVDAEGRVFAQGATGNIWCLNAVTGELVWTVDLLALQGIDQPESEKHVLWGRAGSPLRVDDLLIVPLGGSPDVGAEVSTLIAFDAATGKERWRGGTQQISYASPVFATIHGVPQILSVNQDFASGCALADGRVLWTTSWPGSSNTNANCSNPAVVGDDRVLLSKEYGGGAKLIELQCDDDEWSVTTVWENSRLLKTKFTNVVIDGSYAYGLSDGALECVDLEAEQRQWMQSRGQRFGHGHILLVEDVMLSSTEDGGIALVALDPDKYQELQRFQAIEGKTWNPPTVFGRWVLLRNGIEIALYELPQRE